MAKRLSLEPLRRIRGYVGADRLGTAGLVLAFVVIAIALVGPFLTTGSSFSFIGKPFRPPSASALLGTDVLGRDVLTRVLAGGISALLLSTLATIIGVAVGTALGILAGYRKGVVDDAIMRALDVVMAFPQIILAMLFVSILGPQLWLIVLVVAALHAPQVARVARAATLRSAEEDYVRYAEMLGTPVRTIVAREILPNIATPLAVEFGLRLTYSIALIAGLNFLGLGVQPPTPDWGLMINENRIGIATNPWPVVIPVVLIAVLTIGINLFIDSRLRAAAGREGTQDAGTRVHHDDPDVTEPLVLEPAE